MPCLKPVAKPAQFVTAIAAAPVTTACKDHRASTQWIYASKSSTYENASITRVMDAVPLKGALDAARVPGYCARQQPALLHAEGHRVKPFVTVTIQRVDITVRKRGIFIRGGF